MWFEFFLLQLDWRLVWPPRLTLVPQVAWLGGSRGLQIEVDGWSASPHANCRIRTIRIFLSPSSYCPYPSGFEHAALFFAVLHVFSIRTLYIPRRGDVEELSGDVVVPAPFSSNRMPAGQMHLANCGLQYLESDRTGFKKGVLGAIHHGGCADSSKLTGVWLIPRYLTTLMISEKKMKKDVCLSGSGSWLGELAIWWW